MSSEVEKKSEERSKHTKTCKDETETEDKRGETFMSERGDESWVEQEKKIEKEVWREEYKENGK